VAATSRAFAGQANDAEAGVMLRLASVPSRRVQNSVVPSPVMFPSGSGESPLEDPASQGDTRRNGPVSTYSGLLVAAGYLGIEHDKRVADRGFAVRGPCKQEPCEHRRKFSEWHLADGLASSHLLGRINDRSCFGRGG
jgi:hypothetical protein